MVALGRIPAEGNGLPEGHSRGLDRPAAQQQLGAGPDLEVGVHGEDARALEEILIVVRFHEVEPADLFGRLGVRPLGDRLRAWKTVASFAEVSSAAGCSASSVMVP